MSEKEAETTPAETPEAAAKPQAAKVGVKDRGKVVYTADGERVDGLIADIADGD